MDFSSLILVKIAFGAYASGIGLALLFSSNQKFSNFFSFSCAICGSAAGAVSALGLLISKATVQTPGFDLFPSLVSSVHFAVRVDSLSAFFLLLISVLGFSLSIYSLGYVKGFYGRKSIAAMGALYNVLLLSMTLVALADNAFFFLVVWEIMALSAYFLVSYEHENKETRNAGVLYMVMSHAGTGCIILGFLLLYQNAGDYSFSAFHAAGAKISTTTRNVAFVLFLLGFGVKAGMIPLHIWLPAAHPVAPSNVSALMSGAMIKTGLYGIIRVSFDFLGAPPMWWGVTILVIGTFSAVLGVLYALMEQDLKRLLAYSSIENVGIVLMALGASLMFSTDPKHNLLAALALVAAFYHMLNHAGFKGLLFLGAGAVLHSTHTRNMEELGGLIKRMPQTAFFFLIGAIAISALPPLNGFVSEWLTYQALLQGFGTTEHLTRLLFPIGGALLALTGALAAACFVKAFGISFLAQPRSEQAAKAHEASPSMLAGMGLLTAACVFLGLFPNLILTLLDPVSQQLLGTQMSTQLTLSEGLILRAPGEGAGSVSTMGLALMGICLLPIPVVLWAIFARKSKRHVGATWDCGLRSLTPKMQYSATGFSKPIRMIFRTLFRPRREIQADFEFSRYFATNLKFESEIEETFERRFYRPLHVRILRFSRRMRALQAGSIQAYLIYIFVTLLILLMFAL
jgi:hydrogenase-4 component B